MAFLNDFAIPTMDKKLSEWIVSEIWYDNTAPSLFVVGSFKSEKEAKEYDRVTREYKIKTLRTLSPHVVVSKINPPLGDLR